MPLPAIGTPEWEKEIVFYLSSTESDRKKRAINLGYEEPSSYISMMGRRGILLSEKKKEIPPIAKVIPEVTEIKVPKINIREYKAPKKNGDEEIMVLHCSDGHAGKITSSFNKDVYRQRMENIFDSTMSILSLHRHMYPIRKLHIINTGDNVQGENPHQGSVVGNTEMGAMDQVIKLALPAWLSLICSFKQNFEEIELDLFKGNHGQYSPLAPETSNWDLMLYNSIKSVTDREKGIKANIHDDFASIVNINGFRFFCFHGDDIPCQQGVPFFALDKKLKSWYIQFGGFEYALSGHFHKRSCNELAAGIEHFMSGSLVSDDDWALKKLGISSSPSQNLFGVHPKYGITYNYALVVDKKYLHSKI